MIADRIKELMKTFEDRISQLKGIYSEQIAKMEEVLKEKDEKIAEQKRCIDARGHFFTRVHQKNKDLKQENQEPKEKLGEETMRADVNESLCEHYGRAEKVLKERVKSLAFRPGDRVRVTGYTETSGSAFLNGAKGTVERIDQVDDAVLVTFDTPVVDPRGTTRGLHCSWENIVMDA